MVFGLFGDKPTTKNIQKQAAKAQDRYAQPEYRRAAMEKLRDWGTGEALEALIGRFDVVVQSPHWDEEEKRWLVEELGELGQPAKEALTRFLAKKSAIAFAAKALRRLTDEDEYRALLLDALKARAPDDYRSAQAKQELIAILGECKGDEIDEALIPYLDDHADDVQCTCLDVLERRGGDVAHPRLVELITEDTHSARVLRHVAGAVARLGLKINPEKALDPAVVEDFVVEDGKLSRRVEE